MLTLYYMRMFNAVYFVGRMIQKYTPEYIFNNRSRDNVLPIL